MNTGSASVDVWVAGTTVGSYTLLRELARGGMGIIWLALHRGPAGFERLVVIKSIVTASPDDDASFVQMFLDEARIASQLHHPNIVQVYELGEHGASYYLVMEYLAGQTLGRIAHRMVPVHGAVPVPLAVEIVTAAARGLGHAHRSKGLDGKPLTIVHRDVSPQNILVTYEGLVKVLDFGIAKAVGRSVNTQTGIIKGRVNYMAPEQSLGQAITAGADVFSLGVVFFELVTGTRLYRGADELEVFRRLAHRAPIPKASERTPIDPALDALISTAMEWDPRYRFADGQMFADALEEWSRTHPLEREFTLRQAMQSTFAAELAALPDLQRVAQHTPSASHLTSHSLPDGTAPVIKKPRRSRVPALVTGVVLVTAAATAALIRATDAPALTVAPLPAPVTPTTSAPPVTPAPPSPLPARPVETIADLDPEPPDAGSPKTDARVARRGFLSLETDPWTQVFSGKRLIGETPLVATPMPAGVQRLRLVNPKEGIDTSIELEIPSNGTLVKKLAL